MRTILIKNATIINEGHRFTGHLLCTGGQIKKVIKDGEPLNFNEIPGEVLDAGRKLVIPGVIDDQVHFREPGLTHKADIQTESKAAVAGGITSYMEMPNTVPPTVTNELLREKMEIASRKSWANYSFYLGATNDNLEELLGADPSIVCGIKVFMGSSTGNMLVNDEAALRAIFSNVKIPVAVHCEDEATIQANTLAHKRKYGDKVSIIMHPAIRSEEACYLSSSFAVELAVEYGTRLHVLHVSTAKELELFDSLTPAEKKRITAEVCTHHLWFDQTDYTRLGSKIKWNPAIKSRRDKDALLAGLLNGKLDVIATDHAPHTLEEKSGSYFDTPSGGPLVQHSLSAMIELVNKGHITMELLVEKMCHAPALLFGIKNRGFIREGYQADLVIVDPDSPWTVTRENILYKCGWSPFEGVTFRSRVTHTIVNGEVVYRDGKISEVPNGQQLLFNR